MCFAEEGRPQGQEEPDHQEGKLAAPTANPIKSHRVDSRRQFIINAQQPASDKIFDTAAFEKFLQDKIKVDGRVGNLGDNIKIQQAGEGKIEIIAHNELSGRYLKYL